MSESTFTYTFADLYTDVSEYAGLGRSPTGDNLTLAKRRVNDAYREFVSAVDWHFLKKSDILNLQSGKWQYDLPDNFRELIVPFKYPTTDSWINPTEGSEDTILNLRTGAGTTTGRPYIFAVRPKLFDPEHGMRWEAIFHYEPDGTYAMSYTYRITPNELIEDGDVPIGGPEHAVTIRQMCLAEVEAFDEEKPATYTQKAMASLARSKQLDGRKASRSLGYMNEKSAGYSRRSKTITYNDVDVNA